MLFIFINDVKRKLSIILSVFILSFSISPMIVNAGFYNKFSRKNNNTFSQKYPTVAKVFASAGNVSGASAKVAASSFKKFIDGALVGTGFSAGFLIAIIVLWKMFIKQMVNDAINDSVNSVSTAINQQRDGFVGDIGKLQGDILRGMGEANKEVKDLLKEVSNTVVDVKKHSDDFVNGLGVNLTHGLLVKPVTETANFVGKSAKSIGNGVVSRSKGIWSWVKDTIEKIPMTSQEILNAEENEEYEEESWGNTII